MNDQDRIAHIIESINNIEQFVYGLDQDGFFRDNKVKYACYANLVIISEAVTRISKGAKEQMKGIEWRLITDFRNIIVHEYFRVDWHLVWDVIELNLPPLKEELEDYNKC